jgi:hypothetical protein
MGWDSGQAQAAFEALDGAFRGDGIVVAVAAIESGGDYAGAHQMLAPEGQENLTAEGIGQQWQFALDWIGDPGPVTASCRSQPGGVAALITFTGSKNSLSLLVRFTASGQVAMLRVIAPDEALPW